MTDQDGYSVSESSLPRNLKEATYEMALRNITDTEGILPDEDGGNIASESVSLGPIRESVVYASPKRPSTYFKIVYLLLRQYLKPRGRVERG